MKKRDLERMLRALGWHFLRQGGNHEIWTNGADTEAIPRHSEINETTAKAILKRVRNRPPQPE
ncbi:MAG: type II toxin-antitoxin system HicA family toxin [Pseudomonadota bacterium]